MKSAVEVYIALGSNLGDRFLNLSRARELLENKVTITSTSSVYETPPWGILDQPAFLNQVIQGQTSLAPHALLDFLKGIERQMGRKKTIRFGPRLIDLDILVYGERSVNSKRLQIPHPRMHERAFVLVPLKEIAPELIIPGSSLSVQDQLSVLNSEGIRKFKPVISLESEESK